MIRFDGAFSFALAAAILAPHKENTCSSASYGNGVLLLALRKGQNMYFNQAEFGQRIKELRTGKGWTQEELAGELNIGHVHMNSIERGRKGCSIDLLLELAECFEVSTDYLLTGKEHCSRQTGEKLQHVMDDLAAIIRDLA